MAHASTPIAIESLIPMQSLHRQRRDLHTGRGIATSGKLWGTPAPVGRAIPNTSGQARPCILRSMRTCRLLLVTMALSSLTFDRAYAQSTEADPAIVEQAKQHFAQAVAFAQAG